MQRNADLSDRLPYRKSNSESYLRGCTSFSAKGKKFSDFFGISKESFFIYCTVEENTETKTKKQTHTEHCYPLCDRS